MWPRRIALTLLLLLVASMSGAGTISRGIKSGTGTTAFGDATTILASEMNTDFDTIVNVINGNLTNANINGSAAIAYSKLALTDSILNADVNSSAAIAVSKLAQTAGQLDADIVDDYSTNAAEQATTSSPGTSDNPTLATNLQEEIAQLRHKIEQLTIGTSTSVVASSGGTAALASWIDGPARGGNLVYNGGFDAWQQADCAPCAASEGGWSLVLTPNLADTSLTESEGFGTGKGMLVTGNGAALEGISQTLDGLKADTRYLAVASVRPTTGDSCRMLTTGADTNQLSVDSASDNAWEVIAGTFETDSTPTNVVLELLSVADGDICLFDNVGVFEINTNPVTQANVVSAYDYDATGGNLSPAIGAKAAVPNLSVTFTPPSPGWIVQVHAIVSWGETNAAIQANLICNLDNGSDMAGTQTVDSLDFTGLDGMGQVVVGGLDLNPTPGTTKTYTVECGDDNVAAGSPEYNANGYTSSIWFTAMRSGMQ